MELKLLFSHYNHCRKCFFFLQTLTTVKSFKNLPEKIYREVVEAPGPIASPQELEETAAGSRERRGVLRVPAGRSVAQPTRSHTPKSNAAAIVAPILQYPIQPVTLHTELSGVHPTHRSKIIASLLGRARAINLSQAGDTNR